jgi:hypothetical protein
MGSVSSVSAGGWICPVSLVYNLSDINAEVHVQAKNFPILCSRLVFRSNLTHWAKKKGGNIFASKDLVRGLVC